MPSLEPAASELVGELVEPALRGAQAQPGSPRGLRVRCPLGDRGGEVLERPGVLGAQTLRELPRGGNGVGSNGSTRFCLRTSAA